MSDKLTLQENYNLLVSQVEALITERTALAALVREVVDTYLPIYKPGSYVPQCIFCDCNLWIGKHKPNCLITRARQALVTMEGKPDENNS